MKQLTEYMKDKNISSLSLISRKFHVKKVWKDKHTSKMDDLINCGMPFEFSVDKVSFWKNDKN